MKRILRIPSPGCETSSCSCPYLDLRSGRGECWGVDEDAEMGFSNRVVDNGESQVEDRYQRHVRCPFGDREILVTLRAVKATALKQETPDA